MRSTEVLKMTSQVFCFLVILSIPILSAKAWRFNFFERPEEEKESLGVKCWKLCHETIGCHYYAVDVNKVGDDEWCVMSNHLEVSKCNLCIWNHVRDVPSDASILLVMGGYTEVEEKSKPSLELNSLNYVSTTLLSKCELASPPLKADDKAIVNVINDKIVVCVNVSCVYFDNEDNEWKESFELKGEHEGGFDIVLQDDEGTTKNWTGDPINLFERDLWLIGGGERSQRTTDHLELFDPSTGTTHSLSTTLPVPMAYSCLVEIDEHQYLLTGGRTNDDIFTNKVFMATIDRATKEPKFEEMASLMQARAHHACGMVKTTSMGDEVVVAGGLTSKGDVLNTVEVFNIRTQQWRLGPSMPERRFRTMWVQDGSSFVVLGGDEGAYVLDDAIRFDYEQGWEAVDALKGPRAGGKAIKVTKFQLNCGNNRGSWIGKLAL